jgi:hypothetical protein
MLIQDGKHLPDVTMDAMSSSPQSPALGGISNVSGESHKQCMHNRLNMCSRISARSR